MSADALVIHGMVKADGTLELWGKVTLPPGAVCVTLQPVPYSRENDPFFQMIDRLRAEREKSGRPFRTREEIDAEIREVRDAFDEQVEAIGQLQEECQRRREEADARKAKPA